MLRPSCPPQNFYRAKKADLTDGYKKERPSSVLPFGKPEGLVIFDAIILKTKPQGLSFNRDTWGIPLQK